MTTDDDNTWVSELQPDERYNNEEGPIDLLGVGSCKLAQSGSVLTPNRPIGIFSFSNMAVGKRLSEYGS